MKKLLLYILILFLTILLFRYLQNFDNHAIINKASEIADPGIKGYFSKIDSDYCYYSDENSKEEKVKIDKNTKYLRLFVDNKEVLLNQEEISTQDYIKDQYIEIDVSRGENTEEARALIIRQKIYVED